MKQVLFVFFLLVSSCLALTSSEKVDQFAHAIARTEGFYVRNSIPNRFHNPGNICAHSMRAYPGQIGLDRRSYVVFKNDTYGWMALRHQVEKALNGESKVYNRNMTLHEVAKKYAEDYRPWEKNVAHILHITPETTLWEFFDLPPAVKYEFKENNMLKVYLAGPINGLTYDGAQEWRKWFRTNIDPRI
jgi:hypothetical protein